MDKSTEKESVKVLYECVDLQLQKSNDYQNPNSSIKQADYYPSGVKTILEIIHAKALRARSVIEAMEYDETYHPNFESLEDSFKDMINYASFAVSYIRGQVDGQDQFRDFLNRETRNNSKPLPQAVVKNPHAKPTTISDEYINWNEQNLYNNPSYDSGVYEG